MDSIQTPGGTRAVTDIGVIEVLVPKGTEADDYVSCSRKILLKCCSFEGRSTD